MKNNHYRFQKPTMQYPNIQRIKNDEIAAISTQSTISNCLLSKYCNGEWTIKFLDYSPILGILSIGFWDIHRKYGYSFWLRLILNVGKVGIFQSIDEVTSFTIL
jgi:hypothetical protein